MKAVFLLLALVPFVLSGNVPYTSHEVSFWSATPSGNISMSGTLLLPTVNKPVGGVVLVHGSGPSQRNESITLVFPNYMVDPNTFNLESCGTVFVSSQVFTQVAEHLASEGFAVLRYDKRNCLKLSGVPGCSYELCGPGVTENCVIFNQLTVTDFVTDAVNAAKYLQETWAPKIDPEDLTFIGHSQGSSVIPYAATQVSGVKRVVHLAGVGIPIDEVMVGQLEATTTGYSTGLGICKATNGPQSTITYLTNVISVSTANLEQCNDQFPKIRAGDYNRTDTVQVGGVAPAGFWMDWLKWGSFAEKWRAMSELGTKGIRALAINSPSDQQVWQQFYQPLHAFVKQIPNSKVLVVPGLTHALTPSNLSSNQVSQTVLEAIVEFLTQ
eukprot:TRINITY_DN9390_c0_g1_i1.p1 TRINITY_DN9390_c0_g1~~TRINITY_DN9390_c0_g1_i1.p1  ORF type:complete len:391 (+),score=76.43 TRINITY_DN9390_c0_g1_i1:27-1175(+)